MNEIEQTNLINLYQHKANVCYENAKRCDQSNNADERDQCYAAAAQWEMLVAKLRIKYEIF